MRDLRYLAIITIATAALFFNSIFLPANQAINNNDRNSPSTYEKQYYGTEERNSIEINKGSSVNHSNELSELLLNSSIHNQNFSEENSVVMNQIQLENNSSFKLLSVQTNNENKLPLIYDSKSVDYKSYLPKMTYSKKIKTALNIDNPDIKIAAASAILLNASTGEVMYYKKPVSAVFPASTAKLLTSLIALDWCKKDEKVKVGSEIKLIPSDSSSADLRQGEVLTISSLLEAMLLPSGNDAAYVTAVHVGRKSLKNSKVNNMAAIKEFVRLMNEKAQTLGAQNSNFVTPDGYDAIGQYTTAYDMGLIALAAIKNEAILKTTNKCSSTRTLANGKKLTWKNTNSLIDKNSRWYYNNAVGLKTGTTSIAGKCLISAARQGDDLVISVVMNSSTEGRWTDSIKLLKYGLKKLN
jgi:serine-type D-Ala-D-Ala carboxypeptidase (penicillin-binding protein 5/6)